MKNYWFKRYLNIFLFGFVSTFIVVNGTSFIRFGIDPLKKYLLFSLILSLVVALSGIIFVAIEHYYKNQLIKDIENAINTIEEPFKTELTEFVKKLKEKYK